MNKLFLLALACMIAGSLSAQDTAYNSSSRKKSDKRERNNRLLRMEEEGDLIFNKHNIFGIKIATDGYGISFEKGKYKTPTKTLIYQFELNEKKSPKEKRVSNDYVGTSEILYKLNNFYEFKAAIGQEHLIGGKGNKNGVAVTALYTGGVSLGLIKPYYYNVEDSQGNTYQKTLTQLINDTTEYQNNGAAGFTVGWGHLSVKPGLNAKLGMRFDYGRFNQTISAIETGITAEYYFSKIAQVYLVPEKQFFFNAYVTILFGSRK